MAQLINEAKRFQKLAGLINESQLNENEEAKKAYEDSKKWDKMSNDWSNAITGKGPNGQDTGGMDLYKNDKELQKLFNEFSQAKMKLTRHLYDLISAKPNTPTGAPPRAAAPPPLPPQKKGYTSPGVPPRPTTPPPPMTPFNKPPRVK